MLVHGYFEWRNVAICAAVCRKGDLVIEVGANVGTETVCFADIVGPEGRVIAFEPDETNADILLGLAELNGWRHVEIVRAAVSDTDGEVGFQATEQRAASGIGRVVRDEMSDGVMKVRSVRLDTVRRAAEVPVAAIFIDVEGHEPAVLRGGREVLREDRPVVVLEASPKLLARNGWGLEDLAQELMQARYRCLTIGRFGLEKADPGAKRAVNWLCLPEEKMDLARTIQRTLRLAGWMPMIRGLNPLVRG
jgi:FkbM family methyltransferase